MELPPRRGLRLVNQQLTPSDLIIERAARAVQNALRSEARSEEQGAVLLYWWRRFSWLLCHARRQVARRRAALGTARWKLLSQMLLRRDSEAVYHQAVRALIDPWLCNSGQRPATWCCRRKKTRCLICVADYLRERDPQERRRMRLSARAVFEDRRSQNFSIAQHVIACHDDMGSSRICVACKKRCCSEQGAFIHQTTKHLN